MEIHISIPGANLTLGEGFVGTRSTTRQRHRASVQFWGSGSGYVYTVSVNIAGLFSTFSVSVEEDATSGDGWTLSANMARSTSTTSNAAGLYASNVPRGHWEDARISFIVLYENTVAYDILNVTTPDAAVWSDLPHVRNVSLAMPQRMHLAQKENWMDPVNVHLSCGSIQIDEPVQARTDMQVVDNTFLAVGGGILRSHSENLQNLWDLVTILMMMQRPSL